MISESASAKINRLVEMDEKLDEQLMSLTREEYEEYEDRRTAHRIMAGLASGLANRKKAYEQFGLKLPDED